MTESLLLSLNSGQLLVKGNDVYIGNSSSNLSQLALKIDIPEEVLPYVHPSTKQCNYSVPIVDNLTSSSTTSALSAKQGNVLNSKINNMAAPSLKFTKIFENTKTFSKTSSSQTGAYFTTEIVPESTITTWKNSNYFSIYVVSSITGQITSGDYFEVFIGTSYNSSTTQLCYASISAEDGVVSESNRYLYLRGYPSFFRITTSSGQSNYGFPTSISLITTASHTTDRHTATGTVVIYALSFELG